jgi:hypothetical protein
VTLDPNIYYKQPWEEETIEVDFTNRLAAGDSLSPVATVTIWDGATDMTTDMITSTTVVSPKVLIRVKGGTSGATYKMRIRAVTSNGEKYEEDLSVRVRQIGA